ACEVRPGHMRWQPGRHQVCGHLEIDEMSQSKWNQGQTVEHPRDSYAAVGRCEAEVPPVPVSREPGIEDPSCCRHYRGLTACPPDVHSERDENARHSQQ